MRQEVRQDTEPAVTVHCQKSPSKKAKKKNNQPRLQACRLWRRQRMGGGWYMWMDRPNHYGREADTGQGGLESAHKRTANRKDHHIGCRGSARGGMISNIPIWEELLLEMERPGTMLKWIYVPGHAGLGGNDTAHRLAVEGICLSTLWAVPCTAFSQQTEDTHEPALRSAATPPPPPENIYAVQETTVLGGEDSTDSSPNDHLGAIWLSLGLVEMSEPEEGASQEATATGLLQCDTWSSDDSKPYGWTEGTHHSTDVSDTRKHRKKRRTTPPPPLRWGKGGGPI